MSMVKMDKISILGHLSEKDNIVRALMDKGVVQIEDASFMKEELGEAVENDVADSVVPELDRKIDFLDQAIKTLKNNSGEKAPMFAPKRRYESPRGRKLEIYNIAEQINNKSKEIASLSSEANAVKNTIEQLKPWEKFDSPLNKMETKGTKVMLGTFPLKQNFSEIKKQLEAEDINALIEEVDKDKQFTYAFLVAEKDDVEKAFDFLKGHSFTRISLEESDKTPKDCIEDCNQRIENIEEEKKKILDEIVSFKDRREDMENLVDSFMMERDRRKISENFLKTKSVFYLTGWTPAAGAEALKEEFTDKYQCFVEVEEPGADEEHPVLMQNNKFVEPYEMITNMYSPPSIKDPDFNWIMAIFFTLFYGMMMGDFGYGIIITVGCAAAIITSKFKRKEGNLFKLMLYCGISTMIFGILFGGFFGDLTLLKRFAVLDPINETMRFMGISLTLGIVHVYIALVIQGYKDLKNKDVLGFIGDTIAWIVFIWGVVVLITTKILHIQNGFWAESFWGQQMGRFTLAIWILIIGAILVVATNGREKKNPFMKFFGGISALYGITGYFGDVLSYSRIMALCLSSGIVAVVMNQLARMVWHGPLIILGIVIILFGHALNLFIGALGAYVHTCRLHYVEFFGKFYEGGGRLFTPFKRNTKYTDAEL
ncbi:MAG: V-type ATP synthase subunit I [Firmicutes bacterium]|nr:V-type ATP synthase subunit I [Bacillota bacterium]